VTFFLIGDGSFSEKEPSPIRKKFTTTKKYDIILKKMTQKEPVQMWQKEKTNETN